MCPNSILTVKLALFNIIPLSRAVLILFLNGDSKTESVFKFKMVTGHLDTDWVKTVVLVNLKCCLNVPLNTYPDKNVDSIITIIISPVA